MLLFEKAPIAYCNRLYDLGQRRGVFHVMAELKQTAQAIILMSQI